MTQAITYLDNAATTWPKPQQVTVAMTRFLQEIGANPGRSGHRLSIEATRTVYRTRAAVARLLGVADPLRIIFCPNATLALNLALRGLLRPGDHAVTTSMEHNSVMRPLRALEAQGVEITVVPCSSAGELDPEDVRKALRSHTRLVVMTHASNVVGTLMPIHEVGRITRAADLLLLVDGAQSVGALPFDIDDAAVDLLAFTGHKALLGPTGTGGLVIGERVDINDMRPLVAGGTGSDSDSERQPGFLPDRYESGTLNVVGLAGLEVALGWLHEQGLEDIRSQEKKLCARLLQGLTALPGIKVLGTHDSNCQLGVVSFTVADRDLADIALTLEESFGIACRVGLHCSPSAHRTLGTYPSGTIRFSLGALTTTRDIDTAINAVREVTHEIEVNPR